MPQASVKRLIECKKDQLIDLVLDIEKYPEFVPFCLDSHVYEKNKEGSQTLIIADLTIGEIPLSISDFQVDHLDDNGFVGGIELFPNYRINKYVAWGVNFAHLNSVSDFPIFDESMTSVSFEAMAESSPAYGMNWSGRLSMGHYYPSNDINENSFWLWKGSLGLHYQLHEDFTFLPYFRINYSPTEAAVTDTLWVDYGIEFLLMPNSPWNFSFGLAGIGGHDVIEEGMEFYLSTKGNF